MQYQPKVSYGNLYALARFIKSFEKAAQTVAQRFEFSFGYITFFLEDITLICHYITELEQLAWKRHFWKLFSHVLFDSRFEKCQKYCGKKTICISFVQNLHWYFFVKSMKFAQTRRLLFDRRQLLLVSTFKKKIIHP